MFSSVPPSKLCRTYSPVSGTGALAPALFFFLALSASAQTQLPASPQSPGTASPQVAAAPSADWRAAQKKEWANASPYFNDALPELQAAVPELKDLHLSTAEENLNSLLDRVGQTCVHLLQRMPNVISHEQVITQWRNPKMPEQGEPIQQFLVFLPQHQQFTYLLMSHRTPQGVAVLDEYRMGKNGRRISSAELESHGPIAEGFINDWLRFYPGNRRESHFRFLGREEMDGHKTLVVAFAQIPGSVQFPAQYVLKEKSVQILFQGVAWIDSSNFHIVRLRQDMLAPRPDILLSRTTTDIHFAEVRIPKMASALWVPRECTVSWDFRNRSFQQRHIYSRFRLYAVKTKILLTPPQQPAAPNSGAGQHQ